MANQQHLDVLNQGVKVWNKWREELGDVETDLSGADLNSANLSNANLSKTILSGADLSGAAFYFADLSRADLRGANLRGANLLGANLSRADLSGADLVSADLAATNLREANLSGAHLNSTDLSRADLSGADLSGAYLSGAHLNRADLSGAHLNGAYLNEAHISGADLSGADLSGADLSRATLVETNLAEATLTNCNIYGIAVWNVELKGARQNNLVITPKEEPTITIDNLEVAQFIYLLLNNPKIRDVIDTIAKKAVLILGRFTLERKAVLDGLREALRARGYLPILFDFDKPSSRDFTETVSILAHLSRFVVVDLTSPNSVPYELGTLVYQCIVPFQPILLEEQHEFAMLQDLRRRYNWFLPTHFYRELEDLLASLQTKVIEPAEQKVQELEKR